MKQTDFEALYAQRNLEREQALAHMRSVLQLVATWEARRIDEMEPLLVRLRAAMVALGDPAEVMTEEDAHAEPKRRNRVSLWPEPTEEEPGLEQPEEWVFDSVCEATDGCPTEPDGVCPHGYPSWLLYMGLV